MSDLQKVAAMSSKGQIVIPKDIRDALGLREGDRFEIAVAGQNLILRPVSRHRRNWRTLQGAFGPVDQSTQEILAEGRAEEADREARLLKLFDGKQP